MPSPLGKQVSLFADKAASGYSASIDVSEYEKIMLAIAGTETANLTVKVQGSFQMKADSALDFTAAQSKTNLWDYVACVDLQEGATVITGDTGLVFSGDHVRLYKVNVAGLRTLGLQAVITGGKVTATAYPLK